MSDILFLSDSEKPINGMIDSNLAVPAFSLGSPASQAPMPWIPGHFRAQHPASPRSALGAAEGVMSDVASGGSPPVSPGPGKLHGGQAGKMMPGDSSEEDQDRGGFHFAVKSGQGRKECMCGRGGGGCMLRCLCERKCGHVCNRNKFDHLRFIFC